MRRKSQTTKTKCTRADISIDERLLDKIDEHIEKPENLAHRRNRSAFICWCVLHYFEEIEQKEEKK